MKEGRGFAFATSSLNEGVFSGLTSPTCGSRRLGVNENERCVERHGSDQVRDERRVQSMRAAASLRGARVRSFASCLVPSAEPPRTLPSRGLSSSPTRVLNMFFYVFFLRPPPTHISPGSLVTFTPQLSNDLRTEDF